MRVAAVLLFLGADAGTPSRGLDPYNCGLVQGVSPFAGDLAAVAFSPDGRLCAVGGSGEVVRLYETSRWRERRELRAGGKVTALAFYPDGRRLMIAGGAGIGVRDVETGEEKGALADRSCRVLAFSRDGRRLLAAFEDGPVRGWDEGVRGGQAWPLDPLPRSASGFAFPPDGSRAAVAEAGEGTVRLLKPGAWEEERKLEGIDGAACLAFARDARTLIVGDANGALRVWDVEKPAQVRVLQGHRGAVRAMAVTPDDLYLLSAADDGTVRIWDWRRGTELAQLKHSGVRALALHPTGRMFASAGSDRQLRVWGYVRGGAERERAKGFCGISFMKSGGAVVISSLVPGGPAAEAGLQVGDVVRVIGTKGAKEPAEALDALGSYGEGEEAVFEIERKGEEKQVRVRLGKRPGARERRP